VFRNRAQGGSGSHAKQEKAATLAGGCRLGLRGLDLEAVLPIPRLLNLGESRPLRPADQFQDLRALALGARRAGFLGVGGFGFFAGLGLLLRREGRGFALSAFLGFGRALLLAGALLRGGFLRRDVRDVFRDTGGVFGNK
jgi:hypothetical protein